MIKIITLKRIHEDSSYIKNIMFLDMYMRENDIPRPTHCDRCGKEDKYLSALIKDHLDSLEAEFLCSDCLKGEKNV